MPTTVLIAKCADLLNDQQMGPSANVRSGVSRAFFAQFKAA